MIIASDAIRADGTIAEMYTCDGANMSPPLTFSEIPPQAQSLVLIMDDPDAPAGTYTHWILYNMSPGTLEIPENSVPPTAMVGTGDHGSANYFGPCPPSGVHRYYFRLYALDTMLDLPPGASREMLDQAMEGHIIASAETMGTYTRQSV